MIQALIFDFDGLILDTEVSSFQTWQEIYAEHNCDLPFDTWAVCIGGSAHAFDPCEYLEEQLGRPVPREELRLRRRQRHIALVETQSLLPGVQEYILAAKHLGLKLGVASSSSHEWVDSHLARLGVLTCFDSIKCANDVKHSKPAPDLYLASLAALGVQADEAIALEDSPNGVLAAQQAGIFCVAVPNPVTSRLSLSHADMRLNSLADIPLKQLLKQVQQEAAS